MKIGFGAPVSGSWATPVNLVRIAQRAEHLGYHCLWTFQRLLCDVEGSWGEMYRSVQDPIVTLAYLAGQTSRIRLGVAVINMPFLSPVVLAKQASTLDLLSGGRLDLGLGIGWSDLEFAATGAVKHRSGKRSDEYLSLLRKLWTAEVAEHEGEFYTVPRSSFSPKPVQQPGPPILLGGMAEPALRRAGRLADGWVSSSRTDLSEIGAAIEIIKTTATQAGRDASALRFICRGSLRVLEEARPDRRPLTGSFAEIHADLAELAAKGVTETFLDLNFDPSIGSPSADPARSMEIAEQVLDEFAPSA